MFEVLNKTKEWILDILLPKFCIGCGVEGLYICKDCEVFLSEVDPMLGRGVGHPMSNWTSDAQLPIVSVWEYEGLMEKLIYKIKFDGCYHILDELVEKALAKINLNLPEDTIITFVPMHKKRERQRGFNQSELIAQKVAVYLPRVSYPREVRELLEKVRDNRSQVGLGPKEREENVRGVFRLSCVKPGFTQGCVKPGFTQLKLNNVLLVDDIYTTGATVNECKKVLKGAGVKNIWVFTLARKLRI